MNVVHACIRRISVTKGDNLKDAMAIGGQVNINYGRTPYLVMFKRIPQARVGPLLVDNFMLQAIWIMGGHIIQWLCMNITHVCKLIWKLIVSHT